MKDFTTWFKAKEELDSKCQVGEIYFAEREVWFVAFGVNIGREQDGKNHNSERPVLIYKKLSPTTFYGIPLSTRVKKNFARIELVFEQKSSDFLLDQMRCLDSKRLLRKMGTLEDVSFLLLKKKLLCILN